MLSVEDTVRAYGGAWRCADAEKRKALLAVSFAEDGLYQDPSAEAKGSAALADHIGEVLVAAPGAQVEITSPIDQHHNKITFTWRMVAADGSVVINGVDFGEIGEDGRLSLIVGFFKPA